MNLQRKTLMSIDKEKKDSLRHLRQELVHEAEHLILKLRTCVLWIILASGVGLFVGAYSTGIYLAAQCCEHLNRAIIVEKQYARENRIPIVNVVPQLKAGGSFATAVYRNLKEPVAVEEIQAAAGIDIGDTLIGMHLRPVAVPVRGSISSIGNAHTVMARTRAKFIGGERAIYYKP